MHCYWRWMSHFILAWCHHSFFLGWNLCCILLLRWKLYARPGIIPVCHTCWWTARCYVSWIDVLLCQAFITLELPFHDEYWRDVSVKGRPGVILGSPCSFQWESVKKPWPMSYRSWKTQTMGHQPVPKTQPIEHWQFWDHRALRYQKPSSTEANHKIVGLAQILKKEREKKFSESTGLVFHTCIFCIGILILGFSLQRVTARDSWV